MFAEEIRRAAEAAPRMKLPDVSALLWKAFAAGSVTETEAEVLSALIEARKAPAASPAPVRRHVGWVAAIVLLALLFLFWTIPVIFLAGIANLGT